MKVDPLSGRIPLGLRGTFFSKIFAEENSGNRVFEGYFFNFIRHFAQRKQNIPDINIIWQISQVNMAKKNPERLSFFPGIAKPLLF